MFGSQALETAIGLATMFFVIATASSSLLELGSRLARKRAKDLEKAISAMLAGKESADPDIQSVLQLFKQTSVYEAAAAVSGRGTPAYLSSKSFADAVVEMAHALPSDKKLPEGVRKRIQTLVAEADDNLDKVRAGLEQWFDETMARLRDKYSRFSSYILFALGTGLAVAANASTVDVAVGLWNDPTTRAAVVAAAEKVTSDGTPVDTVGKVATLTDGLQQLALPVGWSGQSVDGPWLASHIGGWIATGLLVMLGAPFWFDLLVRLMSLRAGGPPAPAHQDPTSATSIVAAQSASASRILGPAVSVELPQEGQQAEAEPGARGTAVTGPAAARVVIAPTAAVAPPRSNAIIEKLRAASGSD